MSTSSIILAYNGHIAYPSIIAEMKEPRDFPKALALLESVTITFYVIVAVVIYYYAGSGVESPALSSASPLIGKIAYGIALPTIIVAGVIAALVAAKQIYRHVWAKQPKVMKEKSFRARLSWYAILAALYLVAWIIAEAIPVFQQLLGVIGALFGTWFALGFCAMFWLWMNWKGSMKESYGVNWKKACLACLNVAIFAISAVIVSLPVRTSDSKRMLTLQNSAYSECTAASWRLRRMSTPACRSRAPTTTTGSEDARSWPLLASRLPSASCSGYTERLWATEMALRKRKL